MDKNNSVIDTINKIIVSHKENYEGKNTVEEAKTFNAELYKCLNCTYKIVSKSDFKYFNPITDEKEIEEQQVKLKGLQKAYKENDLNEFADLLYEYVLKYVYSKRNYEDFAESECKHSIDHNLRVAYFVKNVLEKLKNISEEFKKDAIICSILHDVTHRGSPDFTDHESVIQSNLFIKTLSKIDPKYDQDILTNRDKLNINELTDDKILSYILASLISLGDCIDFARCGEIDNNIFTTRVSNVYKLTGIDQVVLNKVIQQSAILCQSMDGRNYPYDNRWLYKETTRIPQESLKINFDLITKEILDTSKSSSESFKNYLLYHFLAKPLTNIRTEESFKQIYSGLRNENLYFLMKSCDWFEDDEKEICNIEKLNEANVAFTKVKSKVDGKYYIIRKTVYDNNFVDLRKEKHFTEFRIYEYDEELKGLSEKEIDSASEDKKKFSKELETKLSEHIINQNKIKELTNIFDKVSKKVIEDESSNQVKRAERLNPFIEGIFENSSELVSKIKKQIQESIETIFNDDKKITEKFEAKKLLAESLKLIKALYKGEKDYTDNYLMLNKICNSETEQELHDSINYTLYHSALRRYHKERVKYNPLLENLKTKNVFDYNIFRGITVDKNFNIQQAFDMLRVFNAKMFDFYNRVQIYIKEDDYNNLQIDNCNTRGNTTSFSINYNESFCYAKSNGILFVIKPNKEKYEEIFGRVDLIDSHYFEVNTPDIETTDVAFALKYKGGLIKNVVFNKNFDGEFYKDGKLISQEELKQYILSIRNDKSKIIDFLEKELKIERVLKVEVETTEEGKETINSINSLPPDIQNLICSNVSDLLKLKQANDIIKLYYEYKNIHNESLNDLILKRINSFISGKEIEKEENFNEKVLNLLLSNLSNIDESKSVKFKTIFDKTFKKFLICNKDDQNKICSNIKRILEREKTINKNIDNIVDDIVINNIYSQSDNFSKETREEIYVSALKFLIVNNKFNTTNLCYFIKKIDNNKLLNKEEITIINKEEGETIICDNALVPIINNKECNDTVLQTIIEKLDPKQLLETRKITINGQERTIILVEAILNNVHCGDTVLQTIIKKFDIKELLENNILTHILNHNKYSQYTFVNTIVHKISTEEFLKEITIIINGNKYTNLLEVILNNEKCNKIVFRSIINKIGSQGLLKENKITIINKEGKTIIYNNALEAILNHEKCSRFALLSIIDNISAKGLLKENKITIINREGKTITCNNVLEGILNNKDCNDTVLQKIIEKFDIKELIESDILTRILNHDKCNNDTFSIIIKKVLKEKTIDRKEYTTILLQTILNNKKCNDFVLRKIIDNINPEELLKKITIRINGEEYTTNLLGTILSNKECNRSVLDKIIEKFDIKELIENNILIRILNHDKCIGYTLSTIIRKIDPKKLLGERTINRKEYTTILLQTILNNKKCDHTVLPAIIEKFDPGELLEKITIRINGEEYITNLLEAILSNRECNQSVLKKIIGKFDIKELIENNILTRILNHDKCNNDTFSIIIDKIDPKKLLEKRTTTINRKEYVILLGTILSNKECDHTVLPAIIEKFDPGELLEKITIRIKGEEYTTNLLQIILSNKECDHTALQAIIGKFGPKELLEENQITVINKQGEKITCNNALEATLNNEKCSKSVLWPIIEKIDDILKCDKCNYSTLNLILEKIEHIETDTAKMLTQEEYGQLKQVKVKIQNKMENILNYSLSDCLAELECRISSSQKGKSHNLNK